jgi:hypothetical protein
MENSVECGWQTLRRKGLGDGWRCGKQGVFLRVGVGVAVFNSEATYESVCYVGISCVRPDGRAKVSTKN